MKVKEWMVRDPVTVERDFTIRHCVELMKGYSIRHLPVVEGQKLVGLVTEGDLRHLFLVPTMGDVKIKDVMIEDPITVSPDTEIEDAAKIIYQKRIGGLPVVDDEHNLVGIITVADLIEAFIELMGVLRSSSRIDVRLGEDPRAFELVSSIIRDNGGEIISVAISGDLPAKEGVYFFRLNKCDVKKISECLTKEGFEVVSYMK